MILLGILIGIVFLRIWIAGALKFEFIDFRVVLNLPDVFLKSGKIILIVYNIYEIPPSLTRRMSHSKYRLAYRILLYLDYIIIMWL